MDPVNGIGLGLQLTDAILTEAKLKGWPVEVVKAGEAFFQAMLKTHGADVTWQQIQDARTQKLWPDAPK